MSKETIFSSFSGGLTSACMTKKLKDKYGATKDIRVVFNNTGKEREETLEFVKMCDDAWGFNTVWIEAVQHPGERRSATHKIVDFHTANRVGGPFEEMIQKYGIPNKVFPSCSRDLKTRPFRSYIESTGVNEYSIALGMRIDEPKRLSIRPNIIYPMAHDFPMTKLQVNQWWYKQPFNLNLKNYEGNCDLCWKKSKRKHMTILLEHPEIAEWWNEMEVKYGEFVPAGQVNKRVTPITFFREKTSVQELLEDSKFPFTKAEHDFTLQQLMFSDPELDFTDGCEERCDPFQEEDKSE